MKKLLGLSLLFTLVSCATQQNDEPVTYFKDEYGIIHKSHVTIAEASAVTVSFDPIPVGCKRLRNIYVKGRSQVKWPLKVEGAKQGATHVKRESAGPYTLGIAYNCEGYQGVASRMERDRLYMQQRAMGELERRRAMAGKGYELTPVKEGALNNNNSPAIPTKKYNPMK